MIKRWPEPTSDADAAIDGNVAFAPYPAQPRIGAVSIWEGAFNDVARTNLADGIGAAGRAAIEAEIAELEQTYQSISDATRQTHDNEVKSYIEHCRTLFVSGIAHLFHHRGADEVQELLAQLVPDTSFFQQAAGVENGFETRLAEDLVHSLTGAACDMLSALLHLDTGTGTTNNDNDEGDLGSWRGLAQ